MVDVFKKVKLEVLRPGTRDPEYIKVRYVNLHNQLDQLVGKGWSKAIKPPKDRDDCYWVIVFNREATEKTDWLAGSNVRGVIVFLPMDDFGRP